MHLTSGILLAFHLCALTAPVTSRPAALPVRIKLAFHRSISSSAIKLAAAEEAAAIWSPYGVDLRFDESGAAPALSLDVLVERTRKRSAELVPVLGRTIVAPPPAEQAPVRISYDAVDALLEGRHGANPLLHDFILAIGLGRVLAHEIGHILLGVPTYHDETGLMRTTFVSDDLARPERSGFRLADRSVSRLRSQIDGWSDGSAAAHCADRDR